MEDVDYEIDEVQQDPSPLLNTLNMMYPYAFFLQLSDEIFSNRANVSVGSSAGYYEVISHVRDAAQVQQYDVVCFHVQTNTGGAHRGRSRLAGGCRWGY